MTITVAAQQPFFQRAANVFSNSDNILEGSFWSIWCLLSTSQWRGALAEKQSKPSPHLSPAEKADVTWQKDKKFALASCSLASGGSMVISWLNQVELIPLGKLSSLVGAVGFGGSGIVSGSKTTDLIQKLYGLIQADTTKLTDKGKRHRLYDMVHTTVKIAFFAAMASWGFLGMAHSLIGGVALFMAQDTAFFCCVCAFLAFIASEATHRLAKTLL